MNRLPPFSPHLAAPLNPIIVTRTYKSSNDCVLQQQLQQRDQRQREKEREREDQEKNYLKSWQLPFHAIKFPIRCVTLIIFNFLPSL